MTGINTQKEFLIYKSESINSNISEQFKSKLTSEDNDYSKSNFKAKVGEPHPFDYEVIEKVAKKFGLITAIIDKINDYALGSGIFIDSEDEKIKKILEKWMRTTNFKIFLRGWFTEALMKGSGYLEIAGLTDPMLENTIKIVNSNTIYIQRDDYGEVIGYNQYLGENLQTLNDDKIISLNKDEIIQLDINKIGSCAYGMGIIFSALNTINDFLSAQKCMHKLMERKANSPIHAKLGSVEKDDYPKQEDINNFGKNLQYMNNTTEWVTGPNVEMKVIDFGNISDKFKGILDNDLKLLSYSFQVPEAILGADKGFVGSTEIQGSGFERNIKAYQEQIAFIIKSKILSKVLMNSGIINSNFEIIWGQPNEAEKRELRASLMGLLSSSIALTPGMKLAYEKKLALLDDIDYEEVEKENSKIERRENRKQKKEFGQQVQLKSTPPGKVPTEDMRDKIEVEYLLGKAPQEIECDLIEEFGIDNNEAFKLVNEEIDELENDYELENWIGEYLQIKQNIVEVIKKDNFENLAAKNAKDRALGMLNKKQIEQLKNIMNEAFEKKLSLHKIADKINTIRLKDRFIEKDGKLTLQIKKDKRAYQIARSETVRLRAEGSLEAFKENNIEEVMFTNVSTHPCPLCEAFDGEVYNLEDASGMIPLHTSCRCKWGKVNG
jgi:SPP1 gp7 family putative phage head morphogenesis protein